MRCSNLFIIWPASLLRIWQERSDILFHLSIHLYLILLFLFYFQTLNSKKILAVDTLPTIVENMAAYLDCLPLESGLGTVTPLWNTLLSQLEILFRRIVFFLSSFEDLVPLLRIMISILRIPCINQFKGVLDPFSKVLSHAIQNQPLEYYYVNELCHLCNRAFNRVSRQPQHK